MTTNYSRSQIYQFDDLNDNEQQQVITDNGFELSDCYSTSYVKLVCNNFTNPVNNITRILPMSMFMRTGSKFTHGIYSTSAFDGYFITFDRDNEYCTIAHKYF